MPFDNIPNRVDYGVKLPAGYRAIKQAQEDQRLRAMRQMALEQYNKEHEEARGDKEKYNAYLQAQMDKWKEEQGMNAMYKQAQTDKLREEQAYPAMATLAKMGKDALAKGDMATLQQAAERYNAIKNSMPSSVTSVLNKPQTYKDAQTGRSVESEFDPEILSGVAENMARSKGVAGIQTQDMKGEQQMAAEEERTKRALAVEEMRGKVRLAIKQMAASGDKQTLERTAARLQEKYLESQDPKDYELYQFAMQSLQAKIPKPDPARIDPNAGIVYPPEAEIPKPIKDKPDPLGIR